MTLSNQSTSHKYMYKISLHFFKHLNLLFKNVSSVSPACRKRRLNGAVSRNNRIKRLAPCRCLDGHVKEPYEMSMALGPDRRSNFFSWPAHLSAVTYTHRQKLSNSKLVLNIKKCFVPKYWKFKLYYLHLISFE